MVVVPIYKNDLNSFEWISLRRTLAILFHHPIALLVPRSKEEAIRLMLNRLLPLGANIQWHAVDDRHLSSHNSYNQLMLQEDFYQYYSKYSHLLICQLDAYVFEDRLLEWCRKPYDYIGAPLYLHNAPYGPNGLFCVGVGGFSLRRIQPFLALLRDNPLVFKINDFLEYIKPYSYKGMTLLLARYLCCRIRNGCRLSAEHNHLSLSIGINEDVVYAKYLPRHAHSFRVPASKVAVNFCIDKHVKLELATLHGSLPFAAHAWWTQSLNLSAWTPFIRELDSLPPTHGILET